MSLRGIACDIDRYIMVKMVRIILSVRTRRLERFDGCTFVLKRQTTWNLKNSSKVKSKEGWQI